MYTYLAFNTCIVEKECTDAEFLINVDEVEEVEKYHGRDEASSKLMITCFPSCF